MAGLNTRESPRYQYSFERDLAPKLTLKSILLYSTPYSGQVIKRDIDKHIRNSIGSAMVEPMLAFSVLAFSLSMLFYTLFLSHSEFATLWILLDVFNLMVCIVTFYILRLARNKGWFENGRFFWVQLLPVISASLCWGTMPVVAGYHNESEFYLSVVTLVGITYIHLYWLPGMFIFNALYAVGSHTYMVLVVYINGGDFISWLTLSIAGIASVTLAGFFVAYWRINNAAQQYALQRQSSIINGLYSQFQLNSSDWVWETNDQHCINYISTNVLGIELDSFENNASQGFANLFSSEDPNTAALKRYLDNHHSFERLVIPNKNMEKPIFFELRGKPKFNEDSQFLGFRGFGRDISESQKYEQLKVSGEKFDMISKFVAKIAHDINNSLMVIQSSVDYLLVSTDNDISNTEKEVFSTITGVVKSTSSVTNELLSYTRQEVLQPKFINLYEFMESSLQKYKAPMADITFDLQICNDILIYVDPIACQRTLDNIITNAIYSMEECGLISVHANYHDKGRGGQTTVTIQDSGKGFSTEALSRAGEPFFTSKRDIGGSGLGMATAIGFAKQSGGELTWHNNTQGKGAVVHLLLPAKKGLLEVTGEKCEQTQVNLSSLSILVVDDNVHVVQRLSRQFRKLGMTVEFATSYDAAVSLVHSSSIKFDLMLMDVRLDGDTRSGPDLAHELSHRCEKFIFMTGYSELIEPLSSYAIISKPFSTAEFVSKVNEIYKPQ